MDEERLSKKELERLLKRLREIPLQPRERGRYWLKPLKDPPEEYNSDRETYAFTSHDGFYLP